MRICEEALPAALGEAKDTGLGTRKETGLCATKCLDLLAGNTGNLFNGSPSVVALVQRLALLGFDQQQEAVRCLGDALHGLTLPSTND